MPDIGRAACLSNSGPCGGGHCEDCATPTWENMINGQINLCDAVRGTIAYTDPKTGKAYALGERPAVLIARPRGWHLTEKHVVIDGEPGAFRPVCAVVEPGSGRRLELWSDQPGCQLYTGNFLDGTVTGKGGVRYAQYQGLCLETQKHPDSIHNPSWPSPVLRPGEVYEHRMELRFGLADS